MVHTITSWKVNSIALHKRILYTVLFCVPATRYNPLMRRASWGLVTALSSLCNPHRDWGLLNYTLLEILSNKKIS